MKNIFRICLQTPLKKKIPILSCKKYQNENEIQPSYYFFPYISERLFNTSVNGSTKFHLSAHLDGKQLHFKLPNEEVLFNALFDTTDSQWPKNLFYISFNNLNDTDKMIENFLKISKTKKFPNEILFKADRRCCIKLFASPMGKDISDYKPTIEFREEKVVYDNPLNFIITLTDIFDPRRENVKI